jgi:hypothetical protein
MFAQQLAMDRLNEALFGYSIDRINQIMPSDRFAHYTRVDVVEKIIEASPSERSLWLRNAQGMNDFSEVSHGLQCFNEARNDWRLDSRFERVLNAISDGMAYSIIVPLGLSEAYLAENTYLSSFSLHDREESLSGKLSMWRAYGGPDNVCLIFNTQPFVTPQSAWELVLSPVLYGGAVEFKQEFEALIQRLERCAKQLSSLDIDVVQANIARAIDFAVLSTKHHGFHEEREWRVIHQHSGLRPDPPSQIVNFNGGSEKIYHLPIENNDKGGIWGASLNEALDRIIIGPIANADHIQKQVVQMMGDAGLTNPENRVVHCGRPFRRQ